MEDRLYKFKLLQPPAEWDFILRRIENVTGNQAVLAGGAVRDTILGKQVKDLDIFVTATPGLRECLIREFGAWDKIQDIPEAYTKGMKGVYSVLAFDPPSALRTPPINIILLRRARTPLEVVQRMDFGICQACHTLAFGTEATNAFLVDAMQWTFTLVAPNADDARNMRRFRRLTKTKFRRWTLVIPTAPSG